MCKMGLMVCVCVYVTDERHYPIHLPSAGWQIQDEEYTSTQWNEGTAYIPAPFRSFISECKQKMWIILFDSYFSNEISNLIRNLLDYFISHLPVCGRIVSI